jgi:hypothetical protein
VHGVLAQGLGRAACAEGDDGERIAAAADGREDHGHVSAARLPGGARARGVRGDLPVGHEHDAAAIARVPHDGLREIDRTITLVPWGAGDPLA